MADPRFPPGGAPTPRGRQHTILPKFQKNCMKLGGGGSLLEMLSYRVGKTPNQNRSGMVNSNMVNSKFHLIQRFFDFLARFLSFHV